MRQQILLFHVVLTAWLEGKLISMQKEPHLSPWWSSRPKTGHNPAPRGASAGLIHLTFTSIQMRPTATASGDSVIKSDSLKYRNCTASIVAGAVRLDKTGRECESHTEFALTLPQCKVWNEVFGSDPLIPPSAWNNNHKKVKMQPKAAAVTTMLYYPVCLLYKCTTGT